MKHYTIALAALLSTGAFASDNFSYQNSLSRVVVQDNLWYNPAWINQVDQQVAANTGGHGGVAFDAFGQRIGVHAGALETPQFDGMDYQGTGRLPSGADAIDIFAGAKLGHSSGFRLTLVQNSQEELAINQLIAPGGGTIHITEGEHTFEQGGDQLSADVRDNKEVTAFSLYGLEFGQVRPKLAFSLGFALPMFNSQRLVDYTATNVQSGGATLSTQYKENVQSKSGFSYELTSNNRYYLQPGLYIGADFVANNYVTEGVSSTLDITTGETESEEQTQRNFSKLQLAGDLTFGLIRQTTSTTLRIEQGIGYERVRSTDQQFATEERGSNDPTGIEESSTQVNHTLRMPLHASIEARTGEKWFWRAGVQANLFSWLINKTLVDNNIEGDDGYELDYTKLDAKGNSRVTDGTNLLLGLGWKPAEKLSINAVLNQQFITDGLLDNGLATEVSISYLF